MRRFRSSFVVPLLSSAPLFLLLVVVGSQLPARATAQDAVGGSSCYLHCPTEIGAACVLGEAAAPAGGSSAEGGTTVMERCACPPYRTGLQCEIPYESCGDGRHVCLHGGECRSGEVDDYGNLQLYCDCSGAGGGGDGSTTTTEYVGKYCQHQVVPADGGAPCTEANVATYCMNNGICNANYP